MEIDITEVHIRQRHRHIDYKNRFYRNIWSLANAFEIPTSIALARLELGWTIKRIINTPYNKENLDAYWRD